MKGSPIISTIVACFVMLGIYICIQTFLSSDATTQPPIETAATALDPSPGKGVYAFIEIQVSSPPSTLLISHPITGKKLLEITNLEETEWTGEVPIPLTEEQLSSSSDPTLELNVKAVWKETPADTQNFIHIALALPQIPEASATLRSPEDIDTTATFHF